MKNRTLNLFITTGLSIFVMVAIFTAIAFGDVDKTKPGKRKPGDPRVELTAQQQSPEKARRLPPSGSANAAASFQTGKWSPFSTSLEDSLQAMTLTGAGCRCAAGQRESYRCTRYVKRDEVQICDEWNVYCDGSVQCRCRGGRRNQATCQ